MKKKRQRKHEGMLEDNYGAPALEPNSDMSLLYGYGNLCVLKNGYGKAYYVRQTLNGYILEEFSINK